MRQYLRVAVIEVSEESLRPIAGNEALELLGQLTAEQQQRLRSLSSRAEISATRFTNEYSFGNFRGDPGRLLEEYFDACLYAANWGTRELAFRLPRALLDAETARRYCDEEYRAWVTENAEHVIVRFRWDDDEGDDWIEGEGLLDPLLAARSELAAGDTRGCSTWGLTPGGLSVALFFTRLTRRVIIPALAEITAPGPPPGTALR